MDERPLRYCPVDPEVLKEPYLDRFVPLYLKEKKMDSSSGNECARVFPKIHATL